MVSRSSILAAACGSLLACSAASQEPAPVAPPSERRETQAAPMPLGAVGNFSQGWRPAVFEGAIDLPVHRLRDGIGWAAVERDPGEYVYDAPTTRYSARLLERGAQQILVVAARNPLYDGGATPHSPEGLAALARFVADMVGRNPAITVVEVGNEFNGNDFVTGPIREAGLAERGRYHLATLRAVARAVREVRPDIVVLGGAAHSIPAGYLWPILEGGGAGLMDGLAIHPYTTPIDQLAAQIGVLRRNPAMRDMPLWITEFGSSDAALAPDELVRAYATLAASGAAAMYWYPLNQRGDGWVPLLERDGSLTPTGAAYRFLQTDLAGETARDVSPDPFTFAIAFGDRAMVLWGEERTLDLVGDGLAARDASGNRLDPAGLLLAPDRALIVTGEAPLRLGENVQLGCTTLVADSFYQFAYPPFANGEGSGVRLLPQLRLGPGESEWQTLPGQQRGGVPWTPYLGRERRPGLRLTAERVLLDARADRPATALFRADLAGAGRLDLEIDLVPDRQRAGSVALTVTAGTATLVEAQGRQAMSVREPIAATAGDDLVIALTPGEPGTASAANYRIRLRDPSACDRR